MGFDIFAQGLISLQETCRWYLNSSSKVVPGDQDLEVETESWSLTIESGGIKTPARPGASIDICTG